MKPYRRLPPRLGPQPIFHPVLGFKEEAGSFDTELVSAMSAVFPGQTRVVADGYTGHLVVPTGELVKYVHMGYASTYDAYRVFTVVAGVVTADCAMSRREFEARKRAAEYMARVFDEEPRGIAPVRA